eukprot:1450625-Rhodomonas_salina.1
MPTRADLLAHAQHQQHSTAHGGTGNGECGDLPARAQQPPKITERDMKGRMRGPGCPRPWRGGRLDPGRVGRAGGHVS